MLPYDVADVAILGGGLSGVLAAGYLAHDHDRTVVMVEPGEPGAAFWTGGLKYLRTSNEFTALLGRLGLCADIRTVHGGALMYPDDVDETIFGATKYVLKRYPLANPRDTALLQRMHYRKTRGTMEGYTSESMNFGGAVGTAYDLNYKALVANCLYSTVVLKNKVAHISHAPEYTSIILDSGFALRARWVISTIPLPAYLSASGVAEAARPILRHRWLHIAHIKCEKPEALRPFNYVYTPTFHRAHRITATADGYDIEVNSDSRNGFEPQDVADAIEWLGVDKAAMMVVNTIPGHILPSDFRGWGPPSTHHLLGRFAAWEARATASDTPRRMADWGF